MRTAFLIYTVDFDGGLNDYWTVGYDHTAPPLMLEAEDNGNILDEVIKDIEGDEDITERILYLGMLNLSPFTNDVFDAVAIDISEMELDLFFKKRGLNKKPASSLLLNENIVLQGLFMKYLSSKANLSTGKGENVNLEENV